MIRPVCAPRESAAVLAARAPAERPRAGFAPRLHDPPGGAQAEIVARAPVLERTSGSPLADAPLHRTDPYDAHGGD